MGIKSFFERKRIKEATQIGLLCGNVDAPLGSVAALLTSEQEAIPLLPYTGAGNYTSAGALMRLPSSLDQVHDLVLQWQAKTFDDRATIEGTLAHLASEVQELSIAVHEGDLAGIKGEAADVLVLLIQAAALLNVDLGEATLEKLQALTSRDYSGAPDSEGRILHKKEQSNE